MRSNRNYSHLTVSIGSFDTISRWFVYLSVAPRASHCLFGEVNLIKIRDNMEFQRSDVPVLDKVGDARMARLADCELAGIHVQQMMAIETASSHYITTNSIDNGNETEHESQRK